MSGLFFSGFVTNILCDFCLLYACYNLCVFILYNQRDATYAMSFIIISALHVSGGFSTYHQELIKLYVQPWIPSCFPAVYSWCGWGGTPRLHIQFYKLLMMGGKTARNM